MRSVVLALSLVALPVFGQSESIVFDRLAYDFEVIDAVPADVGLKSDQAVIAEFVTRKQAAKSVFLVDLRGLCAPFHTGELSLEGFARSLDGSSEKATESMASAYEEMWDRLSAGGRNSLQDVVARSDLHWTETTGHALVEAGEGLAHVIFTAFCYEAGVPPP